MTDRLPDPARGRVDIELELALARNLHGPLSAEVKARIRAAVAQPTAETWAAARTVIVGADGWMTLWQAVVALDPVAAGGVPPRGLLVRALRYATH